MAQDIRKLFKNDQKVFKDTMPSGHEARFLAKLDNQLPVQQPTRRLFTFLNIAASVVILIGMSFGAYKFMDTPTVEDTPQQVASTSSLGDISPQLKKVEDYYLANINLELSKMKVTSDSKELFDGYLVRLAELNKEYSVLADELTQSGPSEHTVNALIDNLKLRLNLLYRLKEKLGELNKETNGLEKVQA